VFFVWIARLNLLDVLDVIWELNALIGAGEGCGIEQVRFAGHTTDKKGGTRPVPPQR